MAIVATNKGGGTDFDPIPEGSHFAICTRVAYLGFQRSEWEGKEKELPKVFFGFEVPDIRVEWKDKNGVKHEGAAFANRTFTLNIGDKSNLGPFITAWRGKQFTPDEATSFDVESLLGKVCNLIIVHKKEGDKVWANISSATKIIKLQQDMITSGQLKVEPSQGLLVYNADHHDQAVYEKLPKFIQKKIDERVVKGDKPKAASRQQQLPQGYEKVGNDNFEDDDIPL